MIRSVVKISTALVAIMVAALAPPAMARPSQPAGAVPVPRSDVSSQSTSPIGPYFLISSHSAKCLTPAGGVTSNNAILVQYNCDADLSRRWVLVDVTGTSVYQIINVLGGKCLTPEGGGTAVDLKIVQYNCDTNPARRWTFVDVTGNREYQIRNVHSGLCLTITGASTSNNAEMLQFPCNTTPPHNERWYLAFP
ncbi:RICIN domain-containing protein [Micromonospora sp. NBC_01655]|uniref:RICIN domain-containing protein n=1 Tax=Micromonospora sp. NBC_01655 TaxID=2975983 RepID=UPI00225BB650|nr:RICIN domain-containing protein [Micromonospora sp. NBC_01655]MCX4474702.1 RICIN domain-containing protein [Micromonospora sp. NBC_01655]